MLVHKHIVKYLLFCIIFLFSQVVLAIGDIPLAFKTEVYGQDDEWRSGHVPQGFLISVRV